MDELFGNLIYLIPIAIVIFRVISAAKGQQKNKQQQKTASGELVKKIQEAQKNPAYGKALTEATEIFIPPTPQPKPAQAPPWPDTKKKPAVKKPVKTTVKAPPVQPPQGEYRSLLAEIFPENAAAGTNPAVQPVASNISPSKQAAGPTAGLTSGSLPGGSIHLTPLQQALVWSEILGAPKSEQGF
jgi:hypothetical protein